MTLVAPRLVKTKSSRSSSPLPILRFPVTSIKSPVPAEPRSKSREPVEALATSSELRKESVPTPPSPAERKPVLVRVAAPPMLPVPPRVAASARSPSVIPMV